MKKYFIFALAIFIISGSLIVLNNALAVEDITQINFTTLSQTININTASAVFTVQTQNTEGISKQVSETIYLNLASSSTGQFSNANSNTCNNATWSGMPFTLTMNNGTANKNFCYRDSIAGVHTLTVTAQNKTWTAATQNIAINKFPQTITITTPAPASAIYGSTFPVIATTSSGLDVVIAATGECSGNGNGSAIITMIGGTGSCVIHYNQTGNDFYNPAPEVTETTNANKIEVTVTADAKERNYGETDPFLTYQIINGTLVGSDIFSGSLSRDVGETAGTYLINQGTLTAGNNYLLNFTGANFTITNPPPQEFSGPQGGSGLVTQPLTQTSPLNNKSSILQNNNEDSIVNNTGAGQILDAQTKTSGEVLGAEKFIFTKNMKLGSKGNEVLELQKRLTIEGYYTAALDGKFGKRNELAVKFYQKANSPLKVDGRVGHETRVALNK